MPVELRHPASLRFSSLVSTFLLTLALAGCSGDRATPLSPNARADRDALATSTAGSVGRAIAAEERYAEALLALPGVQGVGVGFTASGLPCIEVYCLDLVPSRMPKSLDGVPVRVEVVGEFSAFALTDALRPAPLGASLGNNAECLPGTLGCVVVKNGTRYVLSANHVLARQNQGAIGEVIVQPSRPDGSAACDPLPPSNRVAQLSEFAAVIYDAHTPNAMDAAIARITGDVSASTLPEHYGTPSSTIAPASRDLPIQKVGRTTGLTIGSVKSVNAKVKIKFPSGTALFTGQILTSKSFGDFGDSGSLVVTADGTRRPVGMIIGGTGVGVAIVSPIGPILERFGASIAQN